MTDMVMSWLCGNIKLGTLTWCGEEQRALNNVTQALCDIRPPGRQPVTSNTSQHTGPPRYNTLSMTISKTVFPERERNQPNSHTLIKGTEWFLLWHLTEAQLAQYAEQRVDCSSAQGLVIWGWLGPGRERGREEREGGDGALGNE